MQSGCLGVKSLDEALWAPTRHPWRPSHVLAHERGTAGDGEMKGPLQSHFSHCEEKGREQYLKRLSDYDSAYAGIRCNPLG